MSANTQAAINHSDAIRAAIEGIKPDFPAANSLVDQCSQRYYLWKEAERVIKENLDDARGNLLEQVVVPQRKGQHLVHDSRYVAVNCQVVSGPRTLDQKALASALIKQFNLSMEGAEDFIDACRKEAGLQTRLTVQVKR
ncbi:hypothetical protein UFOVP568_17 [uncultured Caudovirales phage]|uniref:Uncharacterized protein n=1 Tax=uncultured Caudovirales phage TaxID=2100421 RepID=A0A6J5MZB5_9CAUD|nr:hypothetical protein UFOVP568_17 [uncultured Caudovirales phage]